MKYRLKDMSWLEAEDAFKKSDMVILPVGTLHGHGPAPISIDFTSVERFADEVGKKTGILTLPVLPYGENDKQKYYPGSISLRPQTLELVYEDMFRALHRNGVRKVLLLNGHGGNREALFRASHSVRELDMIIAIQEWWSLVSLLTPEICKKGIHIVELAVSLALGGKDIVDLRKSAHKGEWGDPPVHPHPAKNVFGDNIKPLGFYNFTYKGGKIIIPIASWDIDVIGPPIITSDDVDELYENGQEIIKRVIDYIVDFAEEFKKVDIKEALKSKD